MRAAISFPFKNSGDTDRLPYFNHSSNQAHAPLYRSKLSLSILQFLLNNRPNDTFKVLVGILYLMENQS